jgi:uncharacterized repeat protein (TIGR03833 family)
LWLGVRSWLFTWREIRLRRTLPPLEVNSSGSTLTQGRGLTTLGLLMDFLRVHQYLPGEYVMDGKIRSVIKPGIRVSIVLKKDQRTGILTEGIVKEILTNSPMHPHGIKVRLESGEVGRVKHIYSGK